MKALIKKYLKSRGLYYKIRYSLLFQLYQNLFKKEAVKAHQREVDLYSSFLKHSNCIFDIGAYDGHKTAAFITLAKKVVCCEPDEENIRLLKSRFRRKKKRVFIEPIAVAEQEGTLQYHVHHPGSAFNTSSLRWKQLLETDQQQKWNETIHFSSIREVRSTTLDQLIRKWGLPDFIKIDVEGAEINVLKGLTSPVHCLTFESLWPEYRENMTSCMEHLLKLDNNYRFNIIVDEQLLLPQFVSAKEITAFLQQHTLTHIEILAKTTL